MNFTFGSKNPREISIYEELDQTKMFIPDHILHYLSNSDNINNFRNWLKQITLDSTPILNTFIIRPDIDLNIEENSINVNFCLNISFFNPINIYEELGQTKMFIPDPILHSLSNSDNISDFKNWLKQITIDTNILNTFIIRPDIEKSAVYSLYYNLIE